MAFGVDGGVSNGAWVDFVPGVTGDERSTRGADLGCEREDSRFGSR